MDTHLAAVGLRQLFAGYDLKQEHKLESITKVFVDILNLRSGLP